MDITESKKFKSAKFDKSIKKKLEQIILCMSKNQKIPENFKDHKLDGSLNGYRICHLKYDTILLYKRNTTSIDLIDVGTHRNVLKTNTFGMNVSCKKAKRIITK